jgi:hypothetical protein
VVEDAKSERFEVGGACEAIAPWSTGAVEQQSNDKIQSIMGED